MQSTLNGPTQPRDSGCLSIQISTLPAPLRLLLTAISPQPSLGSRQLQVPRSVPVPPLLTLCPRGGGSGLAALGSRSRAAPPRVLTALLSSLFRPSPPGPAAAPRALAGADGSHGAAGCRRRTGLPGGSRSGPQTGLRGPRAHSHFHPGAGIPETPRQPHDPQPPRILCCGPFKGPPPPGHSTPGQAAGAPGNGRDLRPPGAF